MKLKINDEYVNVSFWSLLKCTILINLGSVLIMYILLYAILIARFQFLR